MATPSGEEGPFTALKNIAATLLATGQARIALLGNELAIQKQHALLQLVRIQALMFCLGVGVLLLIAAITVQFWEHRLAILSGFTVLFLGVAGVLYQKLMRSRTETEPPFAASLAELQEDLQQLKSASAGHGQKNTD